MSTCNIVQLVNLKRTINFKGIIMDSQTLKQGRASPYFLSGSLKRCNHKLDSKDNKYKNKFGRNSRKNGVCFSSKEAWFKSRKNWHFHRIKMWTDWSEYPTFSVASRVWKKEKITDPSKSFKRHQDKLEEL